MNTPHQPSALARFTYPLAIANLIAQIGIIVTGGLVRLTGSGLGCSTWPMCEPGQFAPEFHAEMTFHPIVEFGNRTLTGVLGVIAGLLLLSVLLDKSRTQAIKRLVWWPIILIAVQAVVGGITVHVDLHPAVVGIHMIISVALVSLSTMIVYRVSPRERADVARIPVRVKQVVATLGLWMLPIVVLGVIVTGAGPHSGDDEVGYRLSVDPMMMARIHALSVWVFVALLAVLAFLMYRARAQSVDLAPRPLTTGFWWVVAVTALQGAVGYYQTFNGLPWVVVTFHLLGVGVFAMVTTNLVLLTRPTVATRR